jgi:formylglycine-generating enzyme required for sulfatase activity
MKKALFVLSILTSVYASPVFPEVSLSLESVRGDGILTLVSEKPVEVKKYDVLNVPGAQCTILSMYKTGTVFRIVARIESAPPEKIRVGAVITLEDYPAVPVIVQKTIRKSIEPKKYKVSIVTKNDVRQMNLIPESYFRFSKGTEKKAAAGGFTYLPSFYADVFEVSNRDYLLFTDSGKAPFPASWAGAKPGDDALDLPVLVSYTEAERYAAWAGKRLPTEEEWEKAASGKRKIVPVKTNDFAIDTIENTVFPWGDRFSPEKSVSKQFWSSEAGKQALKKGKEGLLPVTVPFGISAYGMQNIAGNAPEWTSSWYDGYERGLQKNGNYGKQYKIIKGGGWYSSPELLKTESREFGGIPNLEEDAIAGFRCVKDVADEDVEK